MENNNEKIIQITSGRGPAECCWVVAQVLKLLMQEANALGLTTTVLHREKGTENGTLYSASVKLTGKSVAHFLEDWLGTIQWIGQSKFRKHHRRKNWFIGVNLLKTSNSYSFDTRDVKYEFTRSGGPGGQHVNKVSTAVRAIHVPTGETVFESNSRSQLRNKNEATLRLKQLLEIRTLDKIKGDIKEGWQNHNELDRGDPIRVFKGSDFKPNHERKKYKSKRKSDKQDSFRQLEY